jgi:hypothetical protein
MSDNEFGAGSLEDILSTMNDDLKGNKFKNPFWSMNGEFEGNQKLRILPYLKSFNEKIFYFQLKTHWVNRRPYVCLAQNVVDKHGVMHEDTECPICKEVRRLYKIAGDDRNAEEAKIASQIKARTEYIVRVVVRGRKDEQGNDVENYPVYWKFGKTIFETLKGFIASQEFGNFLSTSDGRDFVLNKRGKNRDANYSGSFLSSATTPVFTDKDKLKLLLTELQKMDYKSLVEFTPYEVMEASLAELGLGETKPQKVTLGAAPEAPVTKKSVEKPIEEETKTDDDLDDLLNSF